MVFVGLGMVLIVAVTLGLSEEREFQLEVSKEQSELETKTQEKKIVENATSSSAVLKLTTTTAQEKKNEPNMQITKKTPKIFKESFEKSRIIEESGEIYETKDPDWSVSSGAYVYVSEGIGKTVQGELPRSDIWFEEYAGENPVDTDGGVHPQNIFRLVTMSYWKNLEQRAYFRITGNHMSDSPNRNGSNGLLFFNRYQDHNNLYYVGIRVDGAVTIKKKKKGTYYTLAHKQIFPGEYKRESNMTLLPQNTWIGMKSTVETLNDQTVLIKVFLDRTNNGNWELILETKDDGVTYGGAPFLEAGRGGIRTDFMDVEFDNYQISERES